MVRNTLFAKKMEGRSFRWLFNLFFAIIIFYNNEIGRILGLQEHPLAISVVWPATGFSLAALLLFGYKVSPGIFIGNFCYNFYYIYINSTSFFPPFIAACFISGGSLLQALVGFYIMARFATAEYLKTVRDMVIFLLFGGLFTCLIASTIGVSTLVSIGALQNTHDIFITWLTFWIGDTMGVYIFTPAIIVWTLMKPKVPLHKYIWEAALIGLIMAAIGIFVLYFEYPLNSLYFPLIAWITYRFGLHGETLAIFLIGFPLIIATVLGQGSFTLYTSHSLMYLVIYLEVLVSLNLIVAGIVNELEGAWELIQDRTAGLQVAVATQGQELKLINSKLFIKDKLNSIGLLTSGIAKYIQFPLDRVSACTQAMEGTIKQLLDCISKHSREVLADCQKNFDFLEDSLKSISKYQSQAKRIAKVMEEQSFLASPGNIEVKFMNINELLHESLMQAKKEAQLRYPDFLFHVTETYDINVHLTLVFPEDLSHALIHLINSAIYSMKEKKDQLESLYNPILSVITINHEDKIEIQLKDNGMGVSAARLLNFFQPFINANQEEELISHTMGGTGLSLYLAREIIVRLFQGEIEVKSEEGEYLQLNVTLPKPKAQFFM
jgi:two-component system, NtrC family, sensor kinase